MTSDSEFVQSGMFVQPTITSCRVVSEFETSLWTSAPTLEHSLPSALIEGPSSYAGARQSLAIFTEQIQAYWARR